MTDCDGRRFAAGDTDVNRGLGFRVPHMSVLHVGLGFACRNAFGSDATRKEKLSRASIAAPSNPPVKYEGGILPPGSADQHESETQAPAYPPKRDKGDRELTSRTLFFVVNAASKK